MVIKRRKKERVLGDLSKEERFILLETYIKGDDTTRQIATSLNIPYNTCNKFIHSFYNKFVNRKEMNTLLAYTKKEDNVRAVQFKHPKYVNEEFLELLSEDSSEELTHQELNFCYLLTETNDSNIAIKESGLDAGLKSSYEGKVNTEKEKAKYYMLRAKYLQRKPNISSLLKQMREDKYKEVTEIVSPSRIQHELLEQYESAKMRGDSRSAIALLRQLGESIALYSNKIQVEDVTPANVLSNLIEMARDADVKELEHGTA